MKIADIQDIAKKMTDTRMVYGAPITADGVTVIPAARIGGGGGGGQGAQAENQGEGIGGGFGLTARPVGAFVVHDGKVSWRPVLDLNRALLAWAVVATSAMYTVRVLARLRTARH